MGWEDYLQGGGLYGYAKDNLFGDDGDNSGEKKKQETEPWSVTIPYYKDLFAKYSGQTGVGQDYSNAWSNYQSALQKQAKTPYAANYSYLSPYLQQGYAEQGANDIMNRQNPVINAALDEAGKTYRENALGVTSQAGRGSSAAGLLQDRATKTYGDLVYNTQANAAMQAYTDRIKQVDQARAMASQLANQETAFNYNREPQIYSQLFNATQQNEMFPLKKYASFADVLGSARGGSVPREVPSNEFDWTSLLGPLMSAGTMAMFL